MAKKEQLPFIPDEEENWIYHDGDYSRFSSIVVRNPFRFEDYNHLPIDQLRGCELYFRDIIAYYLDRNKHNREPTIAWDVGAMAATTWVRLGCAFREQVEAGKLALIASSRTFSPKTSSFRAHTTPEGTAFLQANSHLVHYLTATADEFEDLAITLPNGERVALSGRVHFVHESYSLSLYSTDPEYEVPLLAQMVAKDGIYFSRGDFSYSDHLLAYFYRDSYFFQGILNAHRALTTNLGFTLITQVEDGARKGDDLIYTVFRRPGSPKITVS